MGDVVEAHRAVGLFLLGEIERQLGLVVVAKLGMGGDFVAIAGVLLRVDFVGLVDEFECFGRLAKPDEVHAQVQECFVVGGLNSEQLAVGVDGFVIAL